MLPGQYKAIGNALEKVAGIELFRDKEYFVYKRTF